MGDLIRFLMCGREQECNPYGLTAPTVVQKLLLLINTRPLGINDVVRELGVPRRVVEEHIGKLAKCGLIREENGAYVPAFPIFMLDEQRKLLSLVDRLANAVAMVIKENIEMLRDMVRGFLVTKKGLKIPDIEYVIIGAITLDYEALEVLSEKGVVVKAKRMPDGGEYVFTGFESGLIDLDKMWIWGHHAVLERYWFSSHGRIPAGGRWAALPDIAWLWYELGLSIEDIKSKISELGRILEELLYRDMASRDLGRELGIEKKSLAIDLTLLLTLGYVALVDKKWRLNTLVFTHDEYMKAKLFSRIVLEKVVNIYKDMKNEILEWYRKTLSARNGIPLEEALNPVHHLVANRTLEKLMETGIIGKPSKRPDGGEYAVFMVVLKSN